MKIYIKLIFKPIIYISLIILLKIFMFRNEDLKVMLDSSKDSQKLDAMKRIVGVSTFFIHPAFKCI